MRRQEIAGNIAIVHTKLCTQRAGFQEELDALRKAHPDSIRDVSSDDYQTQTKLLRKIKELDKDIERVNAAEEKRRQNMQNSNSFQGWKQINDRARDDNTHQDASYGNLKKEGGEDASSFEANIFARRKTVPKLLWKTTEVNRPLEDICVYVGSSGK